VEDRDWGADVMPIAISERRIRELMQLGKIKPRQEGKEYVGESPASKGDTVLDWLLVPTGNASNPWLQDCGNPIHHNDEAGSFALAKGKLADCFPLIGFFPGVGTVLVADVTDFRELVLVARAKGFVERAKPKWLQEAGRAP